MVLSQISTDPLHLHYKFSTKSCQTMVFVACICISGRNWFCVRLSGAWDHARVQKFPFQSCATYMSHHFLCAWIHSLVSTVEVHFVALLQ